MLWRACRGERQAATSPVGGTESISHFLRHYFVMWRREVSSDPPTVATTQCRETQSSDYAPPPHFGDSRAQKSPRILRKPMQFRRWTTDRIRRGWDNPRRSAVTETRLPATAALDRPPGKKAWEGVAWSSRAKDCRET